MPKGKLLNSDFSHPSESFCTLEIFLSNPPVTSNNIYNGLFIQWEEHCQLDQSGFDSTCLLFDDSKYWHDILIQKLCEYLHTLIYKCLL